MSRAFVKEDDHEPEPEYRLPDPESPYYDEAAAWALIQGADEGDSRSAEIATGFRWGERSLAPQMEKILEEAEVAPSGALELDAIVFPVNASEINIPSGLEASLSHLRARRSLPSWKSTI